jgi:ankyrin repeat protein
MKNRDHQKSRKAAGAVSQTFYGFVQAVVFDRSLADGMLRNDPTWIHARSSLDETALHYLAVENYVDAVRYLLSKGANVDGAQENGTPLTDAAKLGYGEMVALLIAHGANLEARDLEERTPLLIAAAYGYIEICDILLAAGADTHARDGSGYSVQDIALPRKQGQVATVLAKYAYHPAETAR